MNVGGLLRGLAGHDPAWSLADLPDLSGRTVVVTGPSPGGLGHYAALELARHRARVVLAGRSKTRLAATESLILDAVPGAELDRLLVDLADLETVRQAAAEAARLGPIHVLLNNAGVMATPPRRTPDGFDLQLATNHLGPFLLTGLLLPQLVAGGDSRVVTVSSLMHRVARTAPLRDPREQAGGYLRWPEYGQTKLANLLFTFELDRRLREAGLPVKALAAHPGVAGTHLLANGQTGGSSGAAASILDAATRAVTQSAAAGALPLLMAATADLPGATYVGPSGPGETRGLPRVVDCSALARDREAQRGLWEISEEAVGLAYP